MRALRWCLALMLLALVVAACPREGSVRRELVAPLGPGDGAVPGRDARLVTGEPVNTPQLTLRRGGAAAAGGTGMGLSAAAQSDRELHHDALVIDTHVDTTQAMRDDDYDIVVRHDTHHLDLPRMREGGLDAAFFSIWVDPDDYRGEEAYQRALALFEAVHEADWRAPGAEVVDRADELLRVTAEDHVGLLLGVEGAHALGTADEARAFERLRIFRALGARYMTVTWSNDNPFGHASTDDHPERGLTDAGRRLIAEMERIGVVVDVSHVSDQTFWDIMEVATRPVIASHSSARALAEHPRNMTDEMIRAVAGGGGAVCVNYFTDYIDRTYAADMRRIEEAHPEAFAPLEEDEALAYTARGAAYRALALELEPTMHVPDIDTVADHILHIIEVAGPDAACLGSDFDGVPDMPEGIEDVTGLPALTAELMSRGLPDDDIVKVLGGNVLRVLRANEPAAHSEGH